MIHFVIENLHYLNTTSDRASSSISGLRNKAFSKTTPKIIAIKFHFFNKTNNLAL